MKEELKNVEMYHPFPSKRKNKKYSVYIHKDGKVKLIHFGDSRYEQYFDKIGHYTHLNHNDEKRRDKKSKSGLAKF